MLLSVAAHCKYEVGLKYKYVYDSNSAMTSTPVDSLPITNTFNFSCIASIICLSENKRGFEFQLELTGIHLIQRDREGHVINDISGLKVNAGFKKPFFFTILHTGAVGEVRHFEDESEDILNVKVGIVSQFITLGDNETDDEPTETLDNQGMYLSHWKREKKRGRDDEVELTRRFTDKDFIHHHDKNVTEDSFLLQAFERKKMKSGIVTESAAEQNLYMAGKEFDKQGRRIGDDTEKRKRREANNDDGYHEIYNGTEISCSSAASLQHLGTVNVARKLRGKRSLHNTDKSESSQMKEIPYFNRDFYADRGKKKPAQNHSKKPSSSFAPLVKRKKNQLTLDFGICESDDDDDKKKDEDWVKKSMANSANVKSPKTSFFRSPSPADLTLEDIFRINNEAPPSAEEEDDSTMDKDWEKLRHERIHRFSLGGIADAIKQKAPPRMCPGLDPLLEAPEDMEEFDYTAYPPYLDQKLSSSSLLSKSPFNTTTSNGVPVSQVTCPDKSGLTKCYQIGDGKSGGNDDFGVYAQAVIYSGSQKIYGKACEEEGCNFLLDIDTGVYVKILGRNITIIHLAVNSYHVDNYPATAYIIFNVFGIELGCHFQENACGTFTITICEVKMPVPGLGLNYKKKFFIFEVEFTVGLVAYFNLAFNFEVCPPKGSVAASLPPTLGLSFGVEAELSILKSKCGLALLASTEVSLIPQIELSLSLNAIHFSLALRWQPITIKFEVTVKICILWCWGLSWTVFEFRTPYLQIMLSEKYWPLPWTSNDVYDEKALEDARGIQTGSEREDGSPKVGDDIREAFVALLDDTSAGAGADAGADADAGGGAGGSQKTNAEVGGDRDGSTN